MGFFGEECLTSRPTFTNEIFDFESISFTQKCAHFLSILFIILVGLTQLFWCPTWSKNLWRYLSFLLHLKKYKMICTSYDYMPKFATFWPNKSVLFQCVHKKYTNETLPCGSFDSFLFYFFFKFTIFFFRYDISFLTAASGAVSKADLDFQTAVDFTSDFVLLESIHRLVVCIFEALCLHRGFGGRRGGATPGKYFMGLRVVSCLQVSIK